MTTERVEHMAGGQGHTLVKRLLDEKQLNGKCKLYAQVTLEPGCSLGLGQTVLNRADYKLSFSRMTFPHQLMQMILLEQIYRGYRILNHEPYHK